MVGLLTKLSVSLHGAENYDGVALGQNVIVDKV